ncbi:hypothetical protein N9Y91_02605 [Alphaproteobacteria bacterium]|nr:hypothetical protein [Alphaproteobacteria bacterium]
MKKALATTVVFLFGFYYIEYNSISEPTEVSRDRCEEAREKGSRYQQWNDLKTIYPLTEPIYHEFEGKVYQLNASYDDRSMICLEFEAKR